jgi:hypothetical protein
LAVIALLAPLGVLAWPPVPGAEAANSPDFSVIAGGASATTAPTSGGSSALATKLDLPQDVAVDAAGNVIICDTYRNAVEVLAESAVDPGYLLGSGATWTAGSLYVIAGERAASPAPTTTGSPGAATALNNPEGVTVDHAGNVVIADEGDNEVEVVAVSAANPGYVLGQGASWTRGDLYVIAGGGTGTTPPVPTSSGTPATAVDLEAPAGVAVDGAGNVLVADTGHDLVEVLALGSDRPGYLATTSSTWSPGDLYVVAGGGSDPPTTEGTTGLGTVLDQPSGVAVDTAGDVIIADTDELTVEVLAGSPSDPSYLLGNGAVWAVGYLYVVAGRGTSPPSELGTPADETDLDGPERVATDAVGNVLIAGGTEDDVDVLAVSASDPGYLLGPGTTWVPGNLYVLAGGGGEAPSPSGTDGLSTQLNTTDGVAVASSGEVAVADSGDSEIELLTRAPVPPTLVSAKAGDTTVALGWLAPVSDGGSAVAGYDLFVYAAGSSSPEETLVVGAATTACVVGGLTDGVVYSFAVDAFSTVGTSEASSLLQAVPQAVPQSVPQPVPQPVPTGHNGKSVRPRIVLMKSIAPVRSGFATLFLRCTTQLCRGGLQLDARRIVRLKMNGKTYRSVETVLVSSVPFVIRGQTAVSLPVRVATQAIGEITAARHYRLVVAATFIVKKGLKSTYKVRLVAAS